VFLLLFKLPLLIFGFVLLVVKSICQDINHLKPSSWIFWQIVENGDGSSPWGPLNMEYLDSPPEIPIKGLPPIRAIPKYHLLSMFTRNIRPGDRILSSDSDTCVVSYDAKQGNLKIVGYVEQPGNVTINLGTGFQKVLWTLDSEEMTFRAHAKIMRVLVDSMQVESSEMDFFVFVGGSIKLSILDPAVYSVLIENVKIN
jgi:hypothetical protein